LGGTKLGILISGQLLPVGLPPARLHSGGHVATGHVVCRMCVRSTDSEVIQVLSKEAARWIQELFGRTMVEGTNAGAPPPPLPTPPAFVEALKVSLGTLLLQGGGCGVPPTSEISVRGSLLR
jgi:hypothetical protein